MQSSLLDQWIVRTVRRLINLTETLICRAGARYSVAEAEGFSLLGQRAAALLAEEAASEIQLPAKPSTLVCHRVRGTLEPIDIRIGFELHASTAQEAVYHCIIAHDIAERLNIPGLCTIDEKLSRALACVHLPSQSMTEAIGGAEETEEINDSLIYRTIAESFERFSAICGMKLAPAAVDEIERGGICFAARGRFVESARRLAETLKNAGISAGAADISLIRPFPVEAMASGVRQAGCIAVLDDEVIAEQSDLVAGLHEMASLPGAPSVPIVFVPMNSKTRFERLCAQIGNPAIVPEMLEKALEPPAETADSTRLVIGAAPSGQMSRGLLYDVAAYLSQTDGMHAFEAKAHHAFISALGVESVQTEHQSDACDDIDILFLSHPGLLDIHDIIEHTAVNGIILVLGRSVEVASIWPLFSPEMKADIEAKNISIFTLSGSLLDEYSAVDRYGAFAVHGAILELFRRRSGCALCLDRLKRIGMVSEKVSGRMQLGMEAIREVDRSVSRSDAFDPYFAPQIKLPVLPEAGTASKIDRQIWRSSIRNFFARGQSNDANHHPLPGLSIRPPELNPYLESLSRERYYPLLVEIVKGCLELRTTRLDRDLGSRFSSLSESASATLSSFLRSAETIANQSLLITSARELLGEALEQTVRGDNDEASLISGLRDYIDSLSGECYLIGLNSHTLLDLYVLSVRAARRSRMRDVYAEIRGLVTQLRDALRVDESYGEDANSANELEDAFGPAASELLNTNEISFDLKQRRNGHKKHDPERSGRMTQSLHILEEFLRSVGASDDLIFAYPPQFQIKTTYDRVRFIRHDEPIAVAAGIFDSISQNMVEAFKAMRVARLDIDNAFDPDYHGDILDHFTWQDLSEEELRLMPVICIAETANRLYAQLTPLSRLLRSGKPVDVLITESTADAMGINSIPGESDYNPGFSYLATAYRDAVVSQSTLARPDHLVACLNRMNRLLRPAISVVTCPTWEWRLPPRVQLEAAHCGRTSPIFQYDPSIGSTRVECFNVDGNPEPDKLWPTCTFKYVGSDGEIHTVESAFTFAHALAMVPGYHRFFRILPEQAWNDELVEISAFLKNPTFDRPCIPYIWGVIDSKLRRCIMTRDAANACIDRMQRWRTLRELSMSTQAQLMIANDARESRHALAIEESRQETRNIAQKLDISRSVLRHVSEQLSNCLDAVRIELGEMEAETEDVDLNASMRDEMAYIEGLAGDAPVNTLQCHVQSASEPPLISGQTQTQAQIPPAETVSDCGNPSENLRSISSPVQAPVLPIPRIESDKCIECGACVAINDRCFGFNEDGKAVLIKSDASADELREAAENCSAGCIIIE